MVWRAGGRFVHARGNRGRYRISLRLVSTWWLRSMTQPKIIVVGGGLAGLMATIRVAESGVPVDLFSIVPVKRSHSVCAQGGINAAKNLKGEGDSTWKHFDDTIYGGDFLANQPLVKGMCDAAPAIIDSVERSSIVPRSPEQPLASNCFTRWMNRFGASSRKTKSKNLKAGHFFPRFL